MELLESCFARTETWPHAGKYVPALVSGLPKRNKLTIAQHAGDRSPDRTQRLLKRASWDEMTAGMSQVRRFAAAGLDDAARRNRRKGGTTGRSAGRDRARMSPMAGPSRSALPRGALEHRRSRQA
ncbi:hypothetical protein [Saccharopolyspora pogona]|uniref:hypothetical protein n=1 Tax=Saccharopolyspora pogona TaxID=333966 RepID=UPI0016898895|nr:hypothetical protein [Saccharopolyspora pogona]